jgi:rubredoxin
MAELNFRCKKCNGIFDSDVGEITFPVKPDQRPTFENEIVCPKCGVITIDKVLLTELGQTQITEIHLESVQ